MKVKIEFEVELPDIKHTNEELEEYLRFSFGDNGSMSIANPFLEHGDPIPIFGTFNIDY